MKRFDKAGKYPRKYLVGLVFGRLTVIEWVGRNRSHNYWLCECSCDNIKIIRGSDFISGTTKSCGCHRKEKTNERCIKHNMSNNLTYHSWMSMKIRCNKSDSNSYSDYGGRGVTVCDRWVCKENGFINFYKDMGDRPSKEYSIDRVDNNGNYEPSNCSWVTKRKQCRNRRSNRLIIYKGETKCLTTWAEYVGISVSLIRYRIDRLRWSIEKTFETKVRNYKRKER